LLLSNVRTGCPDVDEISVVGAAAEPLLAASRLQSDTTGEVTAAAAPLRAQPRYAEGEPQVRPVGEEPPPAPQPAVIR